MIKEIRLQKYMADQGVASRRKSEEIILEGRVRVNNKVIKELGSKITPGVDKIIVDGKPIGGRIEYVYLVLNKPKGYLSTTSDPKDRKTVLDLVKDVNQRIYPVGRLDYNTEGLLIMTNDGELTYSMTHPSKELKKTYHATIDGILSIEDVAKLRKGVDIGDYVTAPAEVYILEEKSDGSVVEIIIHEGKYRQVRRMFEALGYDVKRLVRTQIGNITKKGIPRGKYRHLKKSEVLALKGQNSRKERGGKHGKR
ncbi:rRNA pseudouridine synthase [Clostridia bacterium]|nr:rRNA pseudouridine synthase [Clostridia bacterium]